jgi:hypothetical protein
MIRYSCLTVVRGKKPHVAYCESSQLSHACPLRTHDFKQCPKQVYYNTQGKTFPSLLDHSHYLIFQEDQRGIIAVASMYRPDSAFSEEYGVHGNTRLVPIMEHFFPWNLSSNIDLQCALLVLNVSEVLDGPIHECNHLDTSNCMQFRVHSKTSFSTEIWSGMILAVLQYSTLLQHSGARIMWRAPLSPREYASLF